MSRVVSGKLNESIEFVRCEEAGRGFHSVGYKLTAKDGRHFFLKKVTVNDSGFEFPERKLSSLLVGHAMARRAGAKPRPVGLIVEVEGDMHMMPELSDDSAMYHLQEFEPEGVSYFALLNQRKGKARMDRQDIVELENITDYICSLHKVTHPSRDVKKLKAVYNDGLRGELMHPELTLTFLHALDEEHPFLSPSKQGEYVTLLLRLIHVWKDRHDRLRALHGDFWGGNLFLREDASVWVIDYSRVPWGDPGTDIGHWMSQYLWLYHQTRNDYYRELGDAFLSLYVEKSGDKEIMQALSLGFGLIGVLYASLDVYPEVPLETRRRMFENVRDILRENRFVWGK